jgi:hypothetical protein
MAKKKNPGKLTPYSHEHIFFQTKFMVLSFHLRIPLLPTMYEKRELKHECMKDDEEKNIALVKRPYLKVNQEHTCESNRALHS